MLGEVRKKWYRDTLSYYDERIFKLAQTHMHSCKFGVRKEIWSFPVYVGGTAFGHFVIIMAWVYFY